MELESSSPYLLAPAICLRLRDTSSRNMTPPAVTMQLRCVGTRRDKIAFYYYRLLRFSMYREGDTNLQNIVCYETFNKPRNS
jgi:hypothetical protein